MESSPAKPLRFGLMRLFGSSSRPSSTIPTPARLGNGNDPATAFIGQTFLQKYKIRKFLGQGSNAHVFLAEDVRNPGQRVVVKRIKEEAANAPRFEQFFKAEVASMSRFRHPFVVQLIDASLYDPLGPCLVLEYISGITLEAVLQRDQRLDANRVGLLLGPLGHALYAAQQRAIAHRDLKPANLMVIDAGTEKESIRVMDFGFAGLTEKPHIQLAELTGQGPIFACGTPAYVSPEMIRGDSTDARADIYSVGVILYEMLTGRLPFDYEDQQTLLAAHVRETPPRFAQMGVRDVPPRVEAIVHHALAKYPSERPASMRDLVNAYARAVGWDIWEATAPNVTQEALPADEGETIELEVANPPKPMKDPKVDPFVLSDSFQACLPERLAALKLRSFIEEVNGRVVDSQPGSIRVRVDLPSGWRDPASRSGLLTFLSGVRRSGTMRGREPIELELQMKKLDANMVVVQVVFQPMQEFLPSDQQLWRDRCEVYYDTLRKFIMPDGLAG